MLSASAVSPQVCRFKRAGGTVMTPTLKNATNGEKHAKLGGKRNEERGVRGGTAQRSRSLTAPMLPYIPGAARAGTSASHVLFGHP
jgi:hypothetical protein